MIYFIQDTENRRIKIGISSNPVERLKQLQVAQSAELQLIALMDGTHADEQALHRLFTNKRGEWFEPTRDLLAFIRTNAVSSEALASVRKLRGTKAEAEWVPELQGDDYIPSMARLVHYIISTGKGTMQELAATTYSGYENMRARFPELYPMQSVSEYQAELERRVSIQDGSTAPASRPVTGRA